MGKYFAQREVVLKAGSGAIPVQPFAAGVVQHQRFEIPAFSQAIASDAALAFGKEIVEIAAGSGLIKPVATRLNLKLLTPTGLSATAGEIGVGTTVGSGAKATLGEVASAAENVNGPLTIQSLVAGTPGYEESISGEGAVLDARSSAVKLYANIASTWDQTSAESVTVSGVFEIAYILLDAAPALS